MNMPREPLSPEERALAEALARAPGPREPGPSLDARILAAAQAAVDNVHAEAPLVQPVTASTPAASPAIVPPRATSRARPGAMRRWSLGFGVAASLMIAVTIAWQLRPQESAQRVYESAQAPVSDAAPPVSARDQAAPGAAPARSQPLPPVPEAPDVLANPAPMAAPPAPKMALPAPEPPLTARREQTPRAQEVAPQPADPPAASPPQLQRIQTYSPPAPPAPPPPVQAMAPPPPPPAPPAPAAAAGSEVSDARAAAAALARSVQSNRAATQQSAPAAVEQLRSAQEKTSANHASPAVPPQIPGPLADRAVAYSLDAAARRQIAEDRRLPPAQWLQHIRKLRFEGDSALARASLQAFQQAHPDVAIPEDLRPLLP